jgi:hypothetical protein
MVLETEFTLKGGLKSHNIKARGPATPILGATKLLLFVLII